MRPGKANSISAQTLIAAAARGELDEALARQLYRPGPEVVTLALLAASKRIAELQRRCGQQQTRPSTPSAMVPVYAKPNACKRRKRPGARKGHPGTRRAKPARIDRRVEHRLKRCPQPIYRDADALRLAKRLRKHWDYLFTFLDKPEVPFENNFAERMIRPALQAPALVAFSLRKNSQSNRSEAGAATQAILMSIYRTLRMRGHDPTKTIAAALATHLETSQLPPLPDSIAANG